MQSFQLKEKPHLQLVLWRAIDIILYTGLSRTIFFLLLLIHLHFSRAFCYYCCYGNLYNTVYFSFLQQQFFFANAWIRRTVDCFAIAVEKTERIDVVHNGIGNSIKKIMNAIKIWSELCSLFADERWMTITSLSICVNAKWQYHTAILF